MGAAAGGFAGGLLLRGEPESPPAVPRAGRGGPATPPAAAEIPSPALPGAPATTSEMTIEAQRGRIRDLESRIVELQRASGTVPRTRAEKLAIAKEMYDSFLRLSKGASDSEETLKAMARLGELDAEMAPFFIERYRDERLKKDPQEHMGLFLALAAGGPETAALILGLLTDPATSPQDRQELLGQIGSSGGFNFTNRIPVSGELAEVAFRLSGSQEVAERQGAAGLLGGLDSVQSRTDLQRLAFGDADLGVRATALRSLGYVGDQATLHLLESRPPPPTPAGGNAWAHKALMQSLEAAKERLKKRFP